MLRFILRQRKKNEYTGLETETFTTLDVELWALEKLLSRYGNGTESYDVTDLVGVSVIKQD